MYNTRVGIYRYCMHRVRFEIRSRAALMTLSIIIFYIRGGDGGGGGIPFLVVYTGEV